MYICRSIALGYKNRLLMNNVTLFFVSIYEENINRDMTDTRGTFKLICQKQRHG